MLVFLLILYFIIALLAATIFTYYLNDGLCIIVIVSLLWPLFMPFIVISVIFIDDVRKELNKVFKNK